MSSALRAAACARLTRGAHIQVRRALMVWLGGLHKFRHVLAGASDAQRNRRHRGTCCVARITAVFGCQEDTNGGRVVVDRVQLLLLLEAPVSAATLPPAGSGSSAEPTAATKPRTDRSTSRGYSVDVFIGSHKCCPPCGFPGAAAVGGGCHTAAGSRRLARRRSYSCSVSWSGSSDFGSASSMSAARSRRSWRMRRSSACSPSTSPASACNRNSA